MNDKIISFIRTYVPILVGSLLSILARWGLDVDSGTALALSTAITGLFIAGYYTVARLLEARYPKLGVLLGVPKAPAYGQPANPATSVLEPEPEVDDVLVETFDGS